MCSAHAHTCLLVYDEGEESSSRYILGREKTHERVTLAPSFCIGLGCIQMISYPPSNHVSTAIPHAHVHKLDAGNGLIGYP